MIGSKALKFYIKECCIRKLFKVYYANILQNLFNKNQWSNRSYNQQPLLSKHITFQYKFVGVQLCLLCFFIIDIKQSTRLLEKYSKTNRYIKIREAKCFFYSLTQNKSKQQNFVRSCNYNFCLIKMQFILATKFNRNNKNYNTKQSMNNFAQRFFIAFLILSTSIRSKGWQGYGNMSSSNLTSIWQHINQNIFNAVFAGEGGANFDAFNSDFSNHLNELWDPAWNVFTIDSVDQYDTILYGYAFREHWMWYNNYQINGKILNFVIWKDYNCQGWQTVGFNGQSTGFSAEAQNQIANILKDHVKNGITNDIWGSTKMFMNYLVNSASFKGNKAFSIVSTQAQSSTAIYGRICLVNSNQIYGSFDFNGVSDGGRYLLFQTR